MESDKKRAVVLLSGGLDSSTVLAIARAEGFAPYALSFRYGQRHQAELSAAKKTAAAQGVEAHVVAEIDLALFGGSALTSAEIEVPTLEGKHTLKIPAGTQHGSIFRVRGEGVPNLRSGSRGDLIVVTKIEIPKKLSKQQQKLLREFAETEDKSVLPESHGFMDKIRDMLGG